MRQVEVINKLRDYFEEQREIDSCLLIGSFGRKEGTVRSDIDLQIILNPDNPTYNPLQQIRELLRPRHSFFIEEKGKLVLYLNDDFLLCEIFLCKNQSAVDKYFLGSEIDTISDAILFDKTNKLIDYLQEIRRVYREKKIESRVIEIRNNILEFQYRFESCSSAHAKSDGYKFYLLYNNALNCIVRLVYWANDGLNYSYLPPDFLTRFGHGINFLELDGSMFLPKGNELKRKLLEKYYYALNLLNEKFALTLNTEEVISFCEAIYMRDYFWNFRDISTYNPRLKENIIFRSTALSRYQHEPVFEELLREKGITQIIDLRTDDEVNESPYGADKVESISYIRAGIDPRIQSDGFKAKYDKGTNVEIAYQYYAVECKEQINIVVKSILSNNGATLIHCVAGRDRTGSIVSLIHLLVGNEIDVVINDYLATGQNTNQKDINIFLDAIETNGGIESFLNSCGLSESEIIGLRNKLLKK